MSFLTKLCFLISIYRYFFNQVSIEDIIDISKIDIPNFDIGLTSNLSSASFLLKNKVNKMN